MSKAILVLPKMYERCADCDLCILDEEENKHFCATPTGDWILDVFKKADFCPLHPMPEKVYYGKDCSEWDDGYQSGVAATLRAIEGSGEDD
ncbi:MAG: hypothetical protein LUE92_10240 [Clostridiales bacterium]|nr:hypothetical protein [Clostridiales bacterium]